MSDIEALRRADTLAILQDSGETSVSVFRPVAQYDQFRTVYPFRSSTFIETALIQLFAVNTTAGGFKKETKGEIAEQTHRCYFPYTSSIAVGDFILEGSVTDWADVSDQDYYHVLQINPYEDHRRVVAKLVENRRQ